MNIFIIVFFLFIFFLRIKDTKETIKKQNNPKYVSGNIVFHNLTGNIFKIKRQATQLELQKHYPSLSYRPYSAYWVDIVKLVSYNEDITLSPIAESMLKLL